MPAIVYEYIQLKNRPVGRNDNIVLGFAQEKIFSPHSETHLWLESPVRSRREGVYFPGQTLTRGVRWINVSAELTGSEVRRTEEVMRLFNPPSSPQDQPPILTSGL